MATRKAFLIDTTICTACRSCQVACKNWNELGVEQTRNMGSYENPMDLSPTCYTKIKFVEKSGANGFNWLFLKQQCLHCGDAGCMKVCPAPGALYRNEHGAVVFNPEKCTGCKYCMTACPFEIPRFNADTKKISKCHLCFNRIESNLIPACAKACPTGAIKYGERDALIAGAKAAGKNNIYGEKELGGLGCMFILKDKPSAYGLPDQPQIKATTSFYKDFMEPLWNIGAPATLIALFLHYITFGAKRSDNACEGGKDNE
ncbi:MAG: 4Fe-4S ferredoxin [Desulfobulbaceae bacterium A2]|nr:MAG: 4Fe-4S ferredoxin [Desulfobulbaceae bacterium A2]